MRPEYDRITVWKQTQSKYAAQPARQSVLYRTLPAALTTLPRKNTLTKIEFRREDCIDVAVELKRAGAKPLVLNMADWLCAGGCVESGSGAQEEECFRRSNYFRSLHQSYYPLKALDTILSRDIEYYCRGAAVGYVFMDRPERLDMVAAPAVQFPALSRDHKRFARQEDVDLMKDKIRMLFGVARENGNTALILSAWGCGAFGCPPEHMGSIFREVCDELQGIIPTVVFAILGSNYDLFRRGFFARDQ
jgi:uncharacterized protein (TIGR02452 family)